jgi:hypothetical protein
MNTIEHPPTSSILAGIIAKEPAATAFSALIAALALVRCMLVSSICRCCILEGISKLLVESNNADGEILGRLSCGGSSRLFPPIQEDVL